MIGVPGMAQRLFGALRDVGVSVVLISQASSEHSICFAVPEAQGELARTTVGARLRREMREGADPAGGPGRLVQRPRRRGRRHGAHAGRGGHVLRRARQGRRQRARHRAGLVGAQHLGGHRPRGLDPRAARRARRASTCRTACSRSASIGPGLVGRALLAQLEAQAPVLTRAAPRRPARARHRRLARDDAWDGIDSPAGRAARARPSPPISRRFAAHVRAEHLPHAVIVDCTASDEVAERYVAWLARGIHVVTPNKRAGAGPLARYRALRRRWAGTLSRTSSTRPPWAPGSRSSRRCATSSARATSVQKIEGVLSGTLSYVFNTFGERARLLRRGARGPRAAATPSPIRATISPAWTWRASSSSWRARWALRARARRRGAREPGAGRLRVTRPRPTSSSSACAARTRPWRRGATRRRRAARCFATSAWSDAGGHATVALRGYPRRTPSRASPRPTTSSPSPRPALPPAAAPGAGAGRRARGHGRRRVRGSAAARGVPRLRLSPQKPATLREDAAHAAYQPGGVSWAAR